MTRRGLNWRSANRRIHVVQQNIERKHQLPVFGPKLRVRPAIPALRLPQGEKKK